MRLRPIPLRCLIYEDLLFVGVPEEVIKRAAFVLEATGQNKHVERLCNENISAHDQQYLVLVQKLNYDSENVIIFHGFTCMTYHFIYLLT